MIPEVDKKDTEVLIKGIRETMEATRQEIQSWNLSQERPTDEGEAQAVRKLAERAAQQGRQWTGQMLAELGSAYPYPNSQDSTTQTIDKTDVPVTKGLDFPASYTVVQRIKGTRSILSAVKADLGKLLEQCLQNTDFTYCLRIAQQQAKQAGMWLGELLHQFYVEAPKQEAAAPEMTPEEAAADLARVQADSVEVRDFEHLTELLGVTAEKTEHPAAEAGVPELNIEAKKPGKAVRK